MSRITPSGAPSTTGGSVPVSGLVAFHAAPLLLTQGVDGPTALAFGVPAASTGTDVEIDGDGNILFNVAGRYVVALDLFVQSPSAETAGQRLEVHYGASDMPALSILNQGNDALQVPLYGTGGFTTLVTLPPEDFNAGCVLSIAADPGAAGVDATLTISAGTAVYVRRIS